ncbi:hypothetical protein WR25_23808 [Diploscapter pachys]|uniref:Uncharacterized protein n=1 Tax=Diploscapter pachys TaxID=2018661 RepID=A0A2A2KVI2_9BILA|nr:hypothetical protein WR25_23808 [Diploscapter pachys]
MAQRDAEKPPGKRKNDDATPTFTLAEGRKRKKERPPSDMAERKTIRSAETVPYPSAISSESLHLSSVRGVFRECGRV